MSCRAVEILGSGSWPGSGLYTPRHRIMLLLLHFEWHDWRKYRQATGKSNLEDRRQPASPCWNEERGHIDPLEPRCFLPFPGPLTTIILLLVYGLCILKLSGVLCLQKLRQMGVPQGYEQFCQGWPNWGRQKFCSSTRSQDDYHMKQGAVTQNEPHQSPSVLFKHREQHKRQRREFHRHSPLWLLRKKKWESGS